MVAPRIVVLGAGLSGLSAAYHAVRALSSKKYTLVVIEQSQRTGGWLQSERTSPAEGSFLFEKGPRSIRIPSSKALTLQTVHPTVELIASLPTLADKVIFADPAAKRRFLYANGKLRRIGSLPVIYRIMPGLIGSLLHKQKTISEDVTIRELLQRNFGSYITDTIAAPFIAGIYAGDISKLSAKSCSPTRSLFEYEQASGSIIRGLLFGSKSVSATNTSAATHNSNTHHSSSSAATSQLLTRIAESKTNIISFEDGIESLSRALHTFLCSQSEVEFITGAKAVAINLSPDQSLRVFAQPSGAASAMSTPADFVISALPSAALAPLVSEAAADLSSIRYASLAAVNIGFDGDMPLLANAGGGRAFGYLVPPIENEDILGVVFDSHTFPQQCVRDKSLEETRITVMLGGDVPSKKLIDVVRLRDDELLKTALLAVARHTKAFSEEDVVHNRLAVRAVRVNRAIKAIPQYDVGHTERVKRIEAVVKQKYNQRIALCGSWINGVGMNDCIEGGRFAAQQCAEYLANQSASTK